MGLIGVLDGGCSPAEGSCSMDITLSSCIRGETKRRYDHSYSAKCTSAHQRYQRSLEVNKIFRLLKEDMKKMNDYQPKIQHLIDVNVQDQQKVCALQRNQSVRNLRCLNTFYSFQPRTFILAANLLDRFATKVKVQPRYLPCAAAACFLIAAAESEDVAAIPPAVQLLRVSQCDCTPGDVARMQAVVLSKVLPCDAAVVTPLSILERLLAVLAVRLGSGGCSGVSFDRVITLRLATSALCSVFCQAELLVAKPTVVALSALFHALEELGLHHHEPVVSTFLTLQDACNVGDAEFTLYHSAMKAYVSRCDEPAATSSGRHWPRADMRWTISRRTMAQLRPSCSAVSDLPVIHETPLDDSAFSLSASPSTFLSAIAKSITGEGGIVPRTCWTEVSGNAGVAMDCGYSIGPATFSHLPL